jgi:hypothetical protein
LRILFIVRCEEENKTPLNGAYFYSIAGRVFANTAIEENEIKYFTSEEFVIEMIKSFQKSIGVSNLIFIS